MPIIKRENILVPIDNVTIDTVYLRNPDKADERWQYFVEDIKKRGILNTPIARKVRDTYVIIDGGHRFEAAKECGLTEIPLQVITFDEETAADPYLLKQEIMEMQIAANVHKVETKPAEYAKQIRVLVFEHPEKSLEYWSDRFNMSVSWIQSQLKIANSHERVQELANQGHIKLSNLIYIARLPIEEQEAYIDDAQNLKTEDFMTKVSDRLREIRRNQSSRGTGAGNGPTFQPRAKIRKKTELLPVFEQQYKQIKDVNPEAVNLDSPEYKMGYYDGIRYALCLDDESLKQQLQEHEVREREKAEKRLAKEREKDEQDPGNRVLKQLLPKNKSTDILTEDSQELAEALK